MRQRRIADDEIRAMLGDKATSAAPQPPASAQPALSAQPAASLPSGPALRFEQVTVPGRLADVTFAAYGGEIVGVAGSGHLDALAAAAGLLRPASGRIRLPDGRLLRAGQRRAIQQGVALVPGDRRRIGLMLDQSIWENIA